MSIFSRFPYTDFHRLNADWILDKVREAAAAVAESLGLVRQSAADAAAAAAAAEQAVAGSVRYDRAQQLTTAQQEQARENIDAVSETDFTDVTGALYDVSEMQGRQLNKCVRFDAQGLTDAEKEQARENIDAASDTDFNTWVQDVDGRLYTQARQINNCVSFDVAQSLTAAQQAQARGNIGAAPAADMQGAVRFDVSQQLTSAQTLQARENIGAASASDLDDVTDIAEGSVRFDVSQQLTQAQQARARENIDAASISDVDYAIDTADAAVRYDITQQLTQAEQARARTNIGAPQAPLTVQFTGTTADNNAACSHSYAQISEALSNNRSVIMTYQYGGERYYLAKRYSSTLVGGFYTAIVAVDDSTLDSFLTINCYIDSANTVFVGLIDNL